MKPIEIGLYWHIYTRRLCAGGVVVKINRKTFTLKMSSYMGPIIETKIPLSEWPNGEAYAHA